MLFNTLDFAIFLPIVFILYWFVFNKSNKLQNTLIVVASYVFYGWWNWKFLFLILLSTLVDFTIAQLIEKENSGKKRKLLLLISIIVNLGLLGFFKYCNFFLENFVEVFSFLGVSFNVSRLNIVLPVGISFYTFQTLSYTIDVYNGKLNSTKDFIAFAGFVSFFPQLVAGPIERAKNLLPQFYRSRSFDYSNAVDGMRQILWGLLKKVVIADNCAVYVNDIFANYSNYSGLTLLLGGIFFAFQIYGDFSGYSDIAIGTSRLFGFNLLQNFAFPYFSRDIAEFWRRWHMSLSTWFRDYLYIPLGGSRGSLWKKTRNTFIIFLVSGFWHGANWTFVFWGFLNALYFMPLLLTSNNRKNINPIAYNGIIQSFKTLIQMLLTFGLTIIAWIFFRAESIMQAFDYLTNIFDYSNFGWSIADRNYFNSNIFFRYHLILLVFFVVIEWVNRTKQHGLQIESIKSKRIFRWTYYLIILLIIYMFGNFSSSYEFIYFQF